MAWWSEAPQWLREVIAMWGAFLVVTLGICGAAWLTDMARGRRK